MKHPCEVRYERLVNAIEAYRRATAQVADVLPGDPVRAGRLSAFSDVQAVICHIEAEECRHG